MKPPFLLLAAALVMPGLAAAAEPAKPQPEILERDAQGRPTKVRLEGRDYVVCTAPGQDGCINPRDAGLNIGTVPLDHWPGKPASEKK